MVLPSFPHCLQQRIYSLRQEVLYQRLGLLFIETELKKVKEYEKESCADNSRK